MSASCGQWRTNGGYRAREHRCFNDFFGQFGRDLGNRDRRGGRWGRRFRLMRGAAFEGRVFGWSEFVIVRLRLGGTAASGFLNGGLATEAATHQQSLVVFQRAGVGLLLGDAQFREYFDDGVGFYFQLPGQLVDANFTHTLRL